MVRKVKSFIKHHRLAIGVILSAIIVSGLFLYLYISQQTKIINETNSRTQSEIASSKKKIAEIVATNAAQAEQSADKDAVDPKQDPLPTSCNTSQSHNDPSAIDVLVNKKHCIVPLSFYPDDLVTVDGATISQKAAPSFHALFEAASLAGQAFSVSSSYRSYATQVTTYNYWISVSGQEGADTYSAKPGYSEHQTGLAVDLQAGSCSLSCFSTTTQFNWLRDHAAEYGFIQRYPAGYELTTGYKSEEWHYRYVGTAIAQDMKANGVATLEQYWNIIGGDYN